MQKQRTCDSHVCAEHCPNELQVRLLRQSAKESFISMKAPFLSMKEPCISANDEKSATFLQKSAAYLQKSPAYLMKRALQICRNFALTKKSLHICKKAPSDAQIRYGVAMTSRLFKITGLFCRMLCLLQGSFAKETYDFMEPTSHSHPLCLSEISVYLKVQVETGCTKPLYIRKETYLYAN